MDQAQKAAHFTKLHKPGAPLVLYNAWDAGSAKAIAEAGASAVATSSWSMAAAHGYSDGEAIPLDFVARIVGRIVAAIALPVTMDFEGGYSEAEDGLQKHLAPLLKAGIIGVNFEDRRVHGEGLYPAKLQAGRIAALRGAADKAGIPLFINARTDIFFQDGDPKGFLDEALARARAYADAGASGFFVPGLVDEGSIGRLCAEAKLPVNIMMQTGAPTPRKLAELGVARISYGPIPYIEAMNALKDQARKVFAAS